MQVALALAVAAVSVLIAIATALPQRTSLAAANNVLVTGVAAQIAPGSELCREDLELPAGTSGIQVYSVGTAAPGPELEVTITSPAGTQSGRLPGGYADEEFVTGRVSPPLERATTGRACLKNVGTTLAGFGGTAPADANTSKLEVDGEPAPAVLAINPTYEPSSLFDLVPTLVERAAVWAPAWVGPWTFYLLIGAVMLLAGPLAVSLVLVRRDKAVAERTADAGAGRPWRPAGAAWLIAALVVLSGLTWALIVPQWQGPDEISHFAYVQCVAETGQPQTDDGNRLLFSKEHQYAMEQSLTDTIKANRNAKPPWSQSARQKWETLQTTSGAPAGDGCGRATTSAYTPAYYALSAIGYRAFQWGSIWDRALGARLASVLLGAGTALFVWLFAAELFTRRDWVPNAAALAVAFLPQFGFVTAMVNNDALVIFLGALELYLLALALRHGLTTRRAIAIGVVLAIGYLAKPTMGAFVFAIAGVLLVPLWRTRDWRALRFPLLALAGFLAVVAIWAVIAAAYGRSLLGTNLSEAKPFVVTEFLRYVWNFYLPQLPGTTDPYFPTYLPVYSVMFHQFFASFGWNDTLFPPLVYKVLVVISAIGMALLISTGVRERTALRGSAGVVLVGLTTVAALLLVAHYASYRFFPGYPLEQGRYLFPALAVFGVAAASATFGLGRRLAPMLAVTLVAGMVSFTLFSYGQALMRYYA